MTREDDLRYVHKVLEQPNSIPLSAQALMRRAAFLREEMDELLSAMVVLENRLRGGYSEDKRIKALADVIDEMADVQIVLSGMAATFDIDLEAAFQRKCDAQHSKVNKATGRVEKDGNGKTLKGPNYRKPTFTDLAELTYLKHTQGA